MTAFSITARTDIFRRFLGICSAAAFLAAPVIAQAQNSIAVLPAVNVRLSNTSATYASPDTFSTGAVSVTCPAWPKALVEASHAAPSPRVLWRKVRRLFIMSSL